MSGEAWEREVCVCLCVSFFDPPPFSWAEGAHSKHNVDCSLRLSGNATITDHRPSKTRVARGLRGINSPPSALTPDATFITGRGNIVGCPLTNVCQFQEKEPLFAAAEG